MALVNTGQQNYKILKGHFTDDDSLSGQQMPNIQNISLSAIVPNSATITFNPNTSPTPTGGADGDVWYNGGTDDLYKNVAGTWSPLNDRVTNVWYHPSIENLTDCPLP